jgi:replicative DNA helicase
MAQNHSNAQSLLSLLINGYTFSDLKFKIEPNYFLFHDDKIIWEVIEGLWKDHGELHIDILFKEFIPKSRHQEPAAYLTHILTGPLTENPNYYARAMIVDYLQFQLREAIQKTATAPDYADKVIILKTKLDELEGLGIEGDKTYFTLGEIAVNHVDYMQSKIDNVHNYVTSGYPKLDALVRFGNGHLIILGGRSGMGKSMFMSNMIRFQIRAKKKIGLFSLEMSKEEVFDMILAQQTKIPYQQLRNPRDLTDEGLDALHSGIMGQVDVKNFLTVSEKPAVDMAYIKQTVQDMALTMGGLDAIWIDHLHIMKQAGFKGVREMFIHFSGALKELAKELDIPVIVLGQINREADKRPDKRPVISDLKESSSIEADADAILFAYRDSFYNKDDADGEAIDPNKCELIIRKNRHGEQSNVSVNFMGDAVYKTIR